MTRYSSPKCTALIHATDFQYDICGYGFRLNPVHIGTESIGKKLRVPIWMVEEMANKSKPRNIRNNKRKEEILHLENGQCCWDAGNNFDDYLGTTK